MVLSASFIPEGIEAQDRIRTYADYHSDTSIIREWTVDNCVQYNRDRYDHAGYSTFHRVDFPGVATHGMRITENYQLFVKDMVILNDTVYFCGTQNKAGVIGYFPIAVLTNTPVPHYLEIQRYEVSEFKKMDVFYAAGKLHIVTIANSTSNEPYIFDFCRQNGNNWRIAATPDSCTTCVYDDIVVTDSFAIVTRRGSKEGDNIVQRFRKPTTGAGTIFNSGALRNHIPFTPQSPFIMAHCHDKNNSFAVTALNSSSVPASCVWYKALNMTITGAVNYNFYESAQTPKDMKYNKTSKEMTILANRNTTSCVYHISPIPGAAYCHTFTDKLLHSIDYLKLQPTCFVASGLDINTYWLNYLRFVYNGNNECMPRHAIETEARPYYDDIVSIRYQFMVDVDEAKKRYAQPLVVQYYRQCTARDDDDDENETQD